jgi:hypothetical protein
MAVWAWDDLGVRELVDLHFVDGGGHDANRVDAIMQLHFGVLAGRMHLVHEAATHLRAQSPHDYVTAALHTALASQRMDMAEWAWCEYLADPRACCPVPPRLRDSAQQERVLESVAPHDGDAVAALGSITGTLLRGAMAADARPELMDWVWARLDTQPLCDAALHYEFADVIHGTHWSHDRTFTMVSEWALRQPDLAALARFHKRVPLQAAGLVWDAVEPGRTDLVEWCAERSDPKQWIPTLIGWALLQNRLDLARLLHTHGAPYMVEPRCTGTTELCGCDDCYCHEFAVLVSAVASCSVAAVKWVVDTLLPAHGGLAICTDQMRISVLFTAGETGSLPVIEWLVDVAGMGRPSDINLLAEGAVRKSRLNVLWWLIYERGWTIRVREQRLSLWQRAVQPGDHPDAPLTPEEQRREEAKQPCEIVLQRDFVVASHTPGLSIAARWLINAGCWDCEMPQILDSPVSVSWDI